MDLEEEIPAPPEHVVRYAMGLVSGPCIAMIILGFAVRVSEPPVLFVASMQHLAAGIVLSAVAVELVPVITDAESTAGNIAGITLGFVFGVALSPSLPLPRPRPLARGSKYELTCLFAGKCTPRSTSCPR